MIRLQYLLVIYLVVVLFVSRSTTHKTCGQGRQYVDKIKDSPCQYVLQWEPLTGLVLTPQFRECPKGYYKEKKGLNACTRCPGDTTTQYSGTIWPKDCVCPPGTYFRSRDEKCLPCEKGKYKSEWDRSTSCQPCPSGTTTLNIGSRYSSHCGCPAGQFYNKEQAKCTPCSVGSYKARFGKWCTRCDKGRTTQGFGSTELSQCGCRAGQFFNGTWCDLCLNGTYQSKFHFGRSCAKCPVNSTSNRGSVRLSNCTCTITGQRLEGIQCLSVASPTVDSRTRTNTNTKTALTGTASATSEPGENEGDDTSGYSDLTGGDNGDYTGEEYVDDIAYNGEGSSNPIEPNPDDIDEIWDDEIGNQETPPSYPLEDEDSNEAPAGPSPSPNESSSSTAIAIGTASASALVFIGIVVAWVRVRRIHRERQAKNSQGRPSPMESASFINYLVMRPQRFLAKASPKHRNEKPRPSPLSPISRSPAPQASPRQVTSPRSKTLFNKDTQLAFSLPELNTNTSHPMSMHDTNTFQTTTKPVHPTTASYSPRTRINGSLRSLDTVSSSFGIATIMGRPTEYTLDTVVGPRAPNATIATIPITSRTVADE